MIKGGDFNKAGMGFNHQAAGEGQQIVKSMIGDNEDATMAGIQAQTRQGQMQLLKSLNEALAKIFKAIGDAVKGLAG